MYCPICLPKSTTVVFLWLSQVLPHPFSCSSTKSHSKAELRLNGSNQSSKQPQGPSLFIEMTCFVDFTTIWWPPCHHSLLSGYKSEIQRPRERCCWDSGGEKWRKTSVSQSVNSSSSSRLFKQMKTSCCLMIRSSEEDNQMCCLKLRKDRTSENKRKTQFQSASNK